MTLDELQTLMKPLFFLKQDKEVLSWLPQLEWKTLTWLEQETKEEL